MGNIYILTHISTFAITVSLEDCHLYFPINFWISSPNLNEHIDKKFLKFVQLKLFYIPCKIS